MNPLTSLPSILARQRRLRALAGALKVLWILIAFQLAALAVLGWISLRYPLSPTSLILMCWSYGIYLLLPSAYWVGWRSHANDRETVARELDRANPAAPDPFRTSLSLGNHGRETLAHLERLYAAHLPRLSLPGPRFFPSTHRMVLAAGALVLIASAALSGRPGEFFRRAALPWVALDHLPTLRFDLDSPTLVLGVGDTAKAQGRVRNLVSGQTLYAYVGTSAGESRFPLDVAPDGSFAFSFGPAEADFALHFAGDNGRSSPLQYRVVRAPFLERIQAILQSPGYARLGPDTLPSGVVRFPVLAGTRVTWLVESDRGLRRLAWSLRLSGTGAGSGNLLGNGNANGAREDTLGPGKSFRIEREIRVPMDYSFSLEDGQGIRSRPMPPYRVDIIPDLAPEVDLIAPGGDTVLDREAALPLSFRVKDDYGIASLKLVYRVLSDGKPRGGQRDGREWLKQARAGLVETGWDLGSLGLRPEDKVEFHLEAVDNDTVNGPKTGRSATRTLRMPTVQEVLAATRQKEQSAVANLKSALQREKQLERKLERERQSPREEGPPMLADYEVNRIMVDDPSQHQRRAEAALGQMQQSLEKRTGQDQAGGDKSAQAGKEMTQAQSAVRELRDFLKQSEPDLPRGNQGMIPMDERRKNLETLLKSQQDQAAKLASLMEKLRKTPPGKPQVDMAKMQLDNVAKDLDRNIRNQSDLRKMFQEQADQAKAKSDMMDQAIQEQMRMAEDMKGAHDDLKKSMEQGARNGLLSPELMEKMKKVQDLLKEVLPDSLQKLMESKLRGQEVNEEELREKLKEMLEKQTELSENLNRALAMLEALKDRRRMGELKQALGELQARETDLQKSLEAGRTGDGQDAEQRSIQQETQKALDDFSDQAAGKKELQRMDGNLKAGPLQKDMQDVRQSLASASKAKSKKDPAAHSASAASAAKAAAAAAEKLGEMGEMLGGAMAGMEGSLDISEAHELLQESLALSRLQILIRSGSAKRQSEGWESDEAGLYASVAQTAQWLNERVKLLAAKVPFLGQALTSESRGLAAASREASRLYTWDGAEKSLRHNQNLSRELLKLLKMAQDNSQGSGSGSGSPSASGQSGGEGGDLSGQLQGMSGKQMAINTATYQLLKAMMEGRQPGPGQKGGQGGPAGASPGGQTPGGEMPGGDQPGGASPGEGKAEGSGDGPGGQGGPEGAGGYLGGMANEQGELGEKLESLAEGLEEEGGTARKIRGLAEEARRLEEDLRQGRLTPEEVRRRQERFQSRLLEATNAMQERGQSESRQAETSRGGPGGISGETRAAEEARLLKLLREARRNAKGLRLSEGQRKYLDEYYESLLTQ